MFKKLMLNRIAALAFVLAVAAAGAAETQFARLQGRVLDPDRAAIGGATISVEAGNVTRTAVTDEDGSFALSLPPADYTLTVEAPGFQTTAKPVRLISGAHESLEIVLPVAGSTATVTIIASDGIGYRTDTISSATKTLTELRDTPQSITVLPKERLRDQALTSISDVLNYVPGMMSHQGENNRDQFVIRGVSSSADFFLNGVRDDVQYLRDLYNVQRVEILKGPNAMIFGRGGGGGVINRVAREPQSSPLREFTFQGGSFRNRRFTGRHQSAIEQNSSCAGQRSL